MADRLAVPARTRVLGTGDGPGLESDPRGGGAPLERKLRFSAALGAFAVAFFAFAYLTGWTEVATRYTMAYDPEDMQLVESYRLAWVAAPLVALILFVGKRPSVLWTRDAGPAEH